MSASGSRIFCSFIQQLEPRAWKGAAERLNWALFIPLSS
jgi:hypothetical protein